jgi:hypothetical protein
LYSRFRSGHLRVSFCQAKLSPFERIASQLFTYPFYLSFSLFYLLCCLLFVSSWTQYSWLYLHPVFGLHGDDVAPDYYGDRCLLQSVTICQ